MYDKLPNDPIMLMSIINMKLRDSDEKLKEICADFGVSADEIVKKLSNAGFIYDENARRFK